MADTDGLKEEFVRERSIYRGRVFNVSERIVRLPNGREAKRELLYHKGAAAVVPVDEHGMVTLVRQYRVAHDAVLLEIPAGKFETEGEDPLACAHRELLEETGLSAQRMDLLIRMVPTPGYDTETVSVFLATGLSAGSAHPDEDEFLTVERMPLREAADLVMRGELPDAKTAIGILMAFRRLC